MTITGQHSIDLLKAKKDINTQTEGTQEITTGEKKNISTKTEDTKVVTPQKVTIPSSVQKIIANQPGNQPKATITPATKAQIEGQKKEIAYTNEMQESASSKALNAANEVAMRANTFFTTAGTQSIEEARAEGEKLLQSSIQQAGNTIKEDKGGDSKKALNIAMSDGTEKTDPKLAKLRNPKLRATDIFNNGWLSTPGDKVFLTNGDNTIEKTVIKSLDYNSILSDAYRSVTSNYFTNGIVISPKEFKKAYPEYNHISDETIKQFVNECVYDVQNGIHTDINKFADYFGSMAMSDKYVNQKDSILGAVTDTGVINNSLARFASGQKQLEGRKPEEIAEYINAAMTIQDFADMVNEQGYNANGTAAYTLARMFADDYPELKQALDVFDKFDLKKDELQKINDQYNKTIQDSEELIKSIQAAGPVEYKKLIDEYTNQYLSDFNREFMNSFNKERLGDGWSTWLGDFMYGNTYEHDGKFYNKKGEEIEADDVRKGAANGYIEALQGFANSVTELSYDTDIAKLAFATDADNKFERARDVAWDSITTLFTAGFVFSSAGFTFQANSNLPLLGHYYEMAFDLALESLGKFAGGLGDLIGFTDGWSEESKKKYEEALAGLGLMILGRVKAKLKKKYGPVVSKYISNTAVIKSVKSRAKAYVGGMKYIDKTKIDTLLKDRWEKDNKGGIEPSKTPALEIDKSKETRPVPVEEKKEPAKTEKPTKNDIRRQFTKYMWDKAKQEFNNTFESESKKLEKENGGLNLIDKLYQTALDLARGEKRQADGSKITTKGPSEGTKDATVIDGVLEDKGTATEGTTELPDLTAKTATETTKPTGIFENIPSEKTDTVSSTAEIVENVSERPTEKTAEGVIDLDKEPTPEEKKKKNELIKKILNTVQELRDRTRETREGIQQAVDKTISKTKEYGKKAKDYVEKKAEEKRKKQEEKDAKRRKDLLMDESKLTEEDVDIMEENPFSEIIIDIVNEKTREFKSEKGDIEKVRQKSVLTTEEAQERVLEKGIQALREYIDSIFSSKDKISQLFKLLQKNRTINTSDFKKSKDFRNMMKSIGMELYAEETTIPGEYIYKVRDTGGKSRSEMSPEQQDIAKFIEDMFNNYIKDKNISEEIAHNIRRNFKAWNNPNAKKDFTTAVKRQLYDAWNKFLESTGEADLLRALDKDFSSAMDNIEVLKDMLGNNIEKKEIARNTILKWSDEEIANMETIIPGITKMIELAKASKRIADKMINAKLKTDQTRKALGTWIRYGAVMIASQVGGGMGFLLGSLGFTQIERLGNYLKKKVTGQRPDLEEYNRFVDSLKISDDAKSKLKQAMLDDYETKFEELKDKSEQEINEIFEQVQDILLRRQAEEIKRAREAREARINRDVENTRSEFESKQKLPEATQGGVVATEGFTTPEMKIESESPKETYKDRTSTQEKGYDKNKTDAQDTVLSASVSAETTPSDTSIKIADTTEKLVNTIDEVVTGEASDRLIEKGEPVTPENIEKEKQTLGETNSIEDFITEMEKGDTSSDKPTKPNFKKVSYNTLLQFFDKDGNVKPEFKEYEQEIGEAIMQHERNRSLSGKSASPAMIKKRERELKDVEEGSEKRVQSREPFARDMGYEGELGGTADEQIENMMRNIKNGSADTGRGDLYNTQLAEEMLGKKPQGSVSRTSRLEVIDSLPTSQSKVNMLKKKWEKAKTIKSKNQIKEVLDREQAKLDEINNKKTELAEQYQEQVKIQKDENSTTQERKTAQKKKEKLAKEFEDLTEAEEISMIEQQIAKERYEEEKGIQKEDYLSPGELIIEGIMPIKFSHTDIHKSPADKPIVSENGEPITFYHGTPNGGFEKFSLNFRGKSNDLYGNGDYGKGIYFTPYYKTAEGYANNNKNVTSNKPEIYEVNLKMENPLRLDIYSKFGRDLDRLTKEDLRSGRKLFSKEHQENVKALMDKYGISEEMFEKYQSVIDDITDNWMDFDIESYGFDGIISEDGKEVIVPNEEQIIMNRHYDSRKNTEKPQVVSSKNKLKTTQETKVEQEPTQQYNGRKGKENLKNFEEKFADEGDITETDEYGEAIGKTKAQKIREYITESFGKVERGASAMSEEIYDERTAKTKEIWNGTISTKDIGLKYSTKPEDISEKTQSKNAKATFNAEEVTMAFGSREKALIPHEYAHAMDYKFSKELGIGGVTLSEFIDMMIEGGEDMSGVFGENAPLISKFTELFKKIKEQGADVNPAELFARFGEGFVQRAEGKTIETSYGEKFSPELYEEFVNWLGELDNARVNGKLQNGQIQPGEFKGGKDYKNTKVPATISSGIKNKIRRFAQIAGVRGRNTLELVKNLDSRIPKGPNARLNKLHRDIYNTIKYEFVKEVLDITGGKILDNGNPTSNKKNRKTLGTMFPLSEGSVSAYPHIGGDAYYKLKAEGYIVPAEIFYGTNP